MDVVIGLVDALKADATVVGLCGSNIYDHELPESVDFSMPLKLIVVRPHGGPGSPAMLELMDRRFSIFAYAETPNLAESVFVAAYDRLKNAFPSVWAQTYIHWAKMATGPIPNRDAHYQWPYNVSSWLVRASDLTVT